MALHVDPFVFDCPLQSGLSWSSLQMTAKRYRRAENLPPKDGLTLLFFHGIGSHKETWEPIIARLFQSVEPDTPEHYKVREAWAFDWPTHGEAAVVNQPLLQDHAETLSLYDWAPGIVLFVQSEHVRGHRLVLCGHSAGVGIAVHTAAKFYPDLSSVGIIGLILVEPAIVARDVWYSHFEYGVSQLDWHVSSVASRRDRWKSKTDALQYLKKRLPWRMWDPETLELYVEHGLHQLENGSIGLKCDKRVEADLFLDSDPQFEAVSELGDLCRALPVHVIWASRGYLPTFAQDLLNDASEGRQIASVTRLEGGHLIIQEQPLRVTLAIHDALASIPAVSGVRSRM